MSAPHKHPADTLVHIDKCIDHTNVQLVKLSQSTINVDTKYIPDIPMHIIEHATGPPINMHTHTQTHTFLILQQTSPKLIYHSDWKWSLFNSTFAPFALQCIVSHRSQYLVSDNDRFKLFKSFSFSFTLLVIWSLTKKDSISFILLFFSLPLSADYDGGRFDVLHAVQTKDLSKVRRQHKCWRLQLQLLPTQDRAIRRCV